MDLFRVVITVTVAVVVLVDGSPVEYYATKYDHLDLEEILSNRRMVNYYANCLLSKGPCTPQGLELKKILPEALETNCLRCTEKQKVVTYQSIKRLKKEYPKTWTLLQTQWDPKNIYVKRFEESVIRRKPSVPPENEIIIEDRFGDSGAVSKPTTPKLKKTEPTASTLPISSSTTPTKKSSRIPSINSIGSNSGNKPSSPQNNSNGVNVTNQVGVVDQEDGAKPQVSSTENYVQASSTPKAIAVSTSSTLTTQRNSPSIASPGITFDIPQSSVNNSQTQKILSNNSQTQKPPVSVTNKGTTSIRRPDPISQLVSSFLNANRPSTSRPRINPDRTSTSPSPPENLQIRLPKISGLVRKAGIRNRLNTTVQVNLRRPIIQLKLPGLTVNNQVQPFNPVGNIVRGIANAGDRLLETGTSIADSVLTSVRGLFTPTARRNRALRKT